MTRPGSQIRPPELTFDEYMAKPVAKRRLDVIDGIIVMSPTPTVRHQLILQDLYDGIASTVRLPDLGTIILAPCDLLIRETPKLRVRQPDLMFIARDRISREILKRVKILEIAPDLAVEIVSPSDRPRRWAEKLADYASIQMPELWRIDPDDESVEVYRLGEDGYSLVKRSESDDMIGSLVLPGLALKASALFD